MMWEGAELCLYINGESFCIGLSDAQLAVVAKLLGLEFVAEGEISCYSDATLKQLVEMKGNPLQLKRQV